MKLKALYILVTVFVTYVLVLWTISPSFECKPCDTNTSSATATPDRFAGKIYSQDPMIIFDEVNNYRIENGLDALTWDTKLCAYANARAIEIENDYSHNGFITKGESILETIKAEQIAENLAGSARTEQETLTDWSKSPAHNKTMLGNYTHSCVASNGQYVVQLFASY